MVMKKLGFLMVVFALLLQLARRSIFFFGLLTNHCYLKASYLQESDLIKRRYIRGFMVENWRLINRLGKS